MNESTIKHITRAAFILFWLVCKPAFDQEMPNLGSSKALSNFPGKEVLNASSNPEDVFWDDRFGQLGVVGTVLALAVSGGELYVGGSFSMVGNVSANNIAKWDGSAWSTLGGNGNNGTNGNVLAIAVSGSNIYVGGSFTSAGGVSLNNIARWDGSSWSPLGSGITNGDVRAIAAVSNKVYVGGVFTTAGGNNVNNIASWDGGTWSALGNGINNGVNSPVLAIAVKDSAVYAGGSFTIAGGDSASRIALWNSSNNSWSPLGAGVSFGDVNALALNGTDLYAGGIFTVAGSASAKKVAKWDGNNWSPLGSGISGGDINAMAVVGSVLYAAGSFSSAGNIAANNIAKWDGSSWSSLGSGIAGGLVFATAISANTLYVGGSFTTAGGKSSNKFAAWNGLNGSVPVELISFTATTQGDQVELRWVTATEENNFGFEIERMVKDATIFLSHDDSVIQTSSNWEKIAFIQGHGTTTEPQTYSHADDVQSFIEFGSRALTYRLKQIDFNGSFEYSEPVHVTLGMTPNHIRLGQNYPNPFNPATSIEFVVAKDGFTTLKIYNMLGQELKTLVSENLAGGFSYKVNFDGRSFPSGMYVYVLRSGSPSQTLMKKMLLLK